jgi:predicted HicB family RNase H-like nuclease
MDETKKGKLLDQVAVRVDEALDARLRGMAERDGRDLSSYIRRVLQLHVEAADRVEARRRKAAI